MQLCVLYTGQRFVQDIMKDRATTANQEPLEVDPIPFNMAKHGARYRRQKANCELWHIIFVLNTSGKIHMHFNTMTATLGKLVPLLCKPLKISVMKFDGENISEHCYENSGEGQVSDRDATVKWTQETGTTKSVCDYILRDKGCGIGSSAAPCVNVVILTSGGESNTADVCDTITCLQGIRNVDTYAISAGDLQLNCEDENVNKFYLDRFTDLEKQLNLIINRLIADQAPYGCASESVNYSGV